MRFFQMAASCFLTKIAYYTHVMVQSGAFVSTRNSSSYLYVAKRRCRPAAD